MLMSVDLRTENSGMTNRNEINLNGMVEILMSFPWRDCRDMDELPLTGFEGYGWASVDGTVGSSFDRQSTERKKQMKTKENSTQSKLVGGCPSTLPGCGSGSKGVALFTKISTEFTIHFCNHQLAISKFSKMFSEFRALREATTFHRLFSILSF